MPRIKAEWRKYALGSCIVLAMVIGGGTAGGLWTDSVLEATLLIATASILASPEGEPLDRRVLALVALVVAAPLAQLVPLPSVLLEAARPEVFGRPADIGAGPAVITLGVGRTIECLLYVAALAALLLAMLRLRGELVQALLPFFLVGVVVNLAVAAIQYASSSQVAIKDVLPFTITAGVFANRNHLATLLCVCLPFLIYFSTFRGKGAWASAGILSVLLILLATNSRAGALIGAAVVMLSAAILNLRARLGLVALIVSAVVLGLYVLSAWALLDTRGWEDAGRQSIARTTMSGIADNWLIGIGYGTFTHAYQAYEDPTEIILYYINHAHNDYLELLIEGGVLSAGLLALYFALIARQFISIRHNLVQKAAALGILFVLIHSTVDYPLRTMAVAVSFVFFHALLFHPGLPPPEQKTASRRRTHHVRHDASRQIEHRAEEPMLRRLER